MPKHRVWRIRSGTTRPSEFTGIVYNSEGDLFWLKNGLIHRENGPAVEYSDGSLNWFLIDKEYYFDQLKCIMETSLYIGTEKGRHGLYWLKFMIERGMEEFPIIPGMEKYKEFKKLFEELSFNI